MQGQIQFIVMHWFLSNWWQGHPCCSNIILVFQECSGKLIKTDYLYIVILKITGMCDILFSLFVDIPHTGLILVNNGNNKRPRPFNTCQPVKEIQN